MKEKDMWRQLKYKAHIKMPHIILRRIETGSTGIAIPDIYFKTIYDEGWIELKEIRGNISRETIIKIPFQPGQFPWIKNYVSLNGNMTLICSIDRVCYCFKGRDIKLMYNYEDLSFFSDQVGKISELNLPRLLRNLCT